MEGAVAGVIYGLEKAAEAAVGLAKGLSLATAPLKATFKPIKGQSIPRSSHTVSVVKNRAYIFGGEVAPRQPVDNAMHVVILSSTDPIEADYLEVPAKPSSTGGDVPTARVGHSAVVVDSNIYIFGGRGGPSMEALEEAGRVWVFDTTTSAWSHLDPPPSTPCPPARSYHASAATPYPLPHPEGLDVGESVSRNHSYDPDLAYGDPAEVDIPPPGPRTPNTYGSVIIHAGCLSDGNRTSDVWAFDIASRTWSPFPGAPGPGRGGTSLALVRDRLYRFGGFDGTTEIGGVIDFLDINLESTHDDKAGVGLMPISPRRPGWRANIFAPSNDPSGAQGNRTAPSNRSVLGFAPVTTGQGREYILIIAGEGDPSTQGHAGAGKFFDDVWSFQLKPEGGTAAALKDATRGHVLGKETGEAEVVEVRYFDAEGVMVQEGQQKPMQRRGWIGCTPLGDIGGRNQVLVWGGVAEDNSRLGDGWVISVE